MASTFSNFTKIFTSGFSHAFGKIPQNTLVSPSLSPIQILSSNEPKQQIPSRKSSSNETFFLDFSCNQEEIGRITVQIYDDASAIGQLFKELVTMAKGYGYKGSRVYAVCPNEWCLMGDLIYYEKNPNQLDRECGYISQWNGQETENGEKMAPSLLPSVYTRAFCIPMEKTNFEDERGSIVSVASELKFDKGEKCEWQFGPQFKVIFSKPSVSSGAVFGEVTSGMSLLEQISAYGTTNMEPSNRITISNCGLITA